MYCESCGKKLIRGYQFCMECGTPVPPDAGENEEENPAEVNPSEENTADVSEVPSVPTVEPINSEGGALVFCINCGMHMQTSNTVCEKCGMPLGNAPVNPAPKTVVPAVNPDIGLMGESLGGELEGMTEEEIEQLNSFMNGNTASIGESFSNESSGDMDAISSADSLENLAAQLASFSAVDNLMPSIGIEPAAAPVRQAEPKLGEKREVEDFAMDIPSLSTDLPDNGVPVINIGSMDERPDEDVNLDPYAFVNNVMDNSVPTFTPPPAPVSKPEEIPSVNDVLASMQEACPEAAAPAVEPVAPVFEEDEPTVEPIAPVFEEAAPAVEPIAPVFEESAPTVEPVAPVFEEDEPTVEPIAPVFEEAAPSVEPVAPVFEESAPTVEPIAPVFEEAAPAVEPVAPVFEEAAPAVEPVAPVFEESAPAENFEPPIIEAAPVIEEGAPFIAEAPAFTPPPAPAPEPAPLPRPAKKKPEDEIDPALGKLSYCRNCGQDMYEKEPVCKNCGAPYRAPAKHDPSLDKRNGSGAKGEPTGIKKFLPFIIGGGAVAAILIVLLLTTNNKPGNNNSLSGNETLNVNTTTSAATTTAPVEDNPAPEENSTPAPEKTDVPVESEPAVSTADESAPETPDKNEVTDTSDVSDTPETPDTPDATTPSSTTTHRTMPHTTGGNPGTSSNNAVSSNPVTTTTTKSATTTRTTPPATSSSKPAITAAKTISLEKDREAIMDAVSLMSGEIGKIDSLAQGIIYAMENSTGNAETARTAYLSRDFAKNMISSIDSGKNAVDAAVKNAKPKNSSLNSQYDSLTALQKKYNAYYNFIKDPSGSTSKFTSSCSTYLSDFTSSVSSSFKYTKFTDSYTANESAAAYIAAMKDAVTAANNAVSAFNNLQTKISKVDKNSFDTAAIQELSKSANTKSLANAVAYAQEVAAYRLMLANAPTGYSAAYDNLKALSDELNNLVDLYNMIQENSLSSFKNDSSSNITAANTAIAAINKVIG